MSSNEMSKYSHELVGAGLGDTSMDGGCLEQSQGMVKLYPTLLPFTVLVGPQKTGTEGLSMELPKLSSYTNKEMFVHPSTHDAV